MSKEEWKLELRKEMSILFSDFGLCHSFVIRHSDFVIPTCLCHAARTSASRSAARPAFNLACRSADCDLNHASVSRAVSGSDRNVRLLASAWLMFVRAIPLSSPVHTGISDHASTFSCLRKSEGTQVNFALQ